MDAAKKLEGVGFRFSEPERRWTKNGIRWLISAEIPKQLLDGFFLFWKKNKPLMNINGYSVRKIDNKWYVNKWGRTYKSVCDFKKSPWDDIDESTLNVSDLPNYEVKNTNGLMEWQHRSVSRLCASILKHNAAIDGSDTGLGKTFVSIAVARELGLKLGVICPNQVKAIWRRIIKEHFNMKPQFVINYESLRTGNKKEIATWAMVRHKSKDRRIFQWNAPDDTLIIYDESHKLKGVNTKNARCAMFAKEQGYKILCCSATSAINPMEMRALGYILGLHRGHSDFYQWAEKHDCEQGRFGYQFMGNTKVLKKLHKDLFLDRGVRLRRDDVPGFPECDTQALPYNIDKQSELNINQVYAEMQAELAKLKKKTMSASEKQANILTIQLRARQKSELLKVPLFIDIIKDYLADGLSCAVFLNFTETIEALSRRLKVEHIIWGKNKKTKTYDERQRFIDEFQDDKVRIILVNVKAGGLGLSLHDVCGHYPRIAIISPSYSAVDMRQVLGRVHRAGAKTKALQRIVFIANTIEEEVCEKVRAKLKDLDVINDGDLAFSATQSF